MQDCGRAGGREEVESGAASSAHLLPHTPVLPSVSTALTDESKLTSSRTVSALEGEGVGVSHNTQDGHAYCRADL